MKAGALCANLCQYAARLSPNTGSPTTQCGGAGGPCSRTLVVTVIRLLTLSANVARMMTNGATRTRATDNVIKAAARPLRPPTARSHHSYKGHVEKHRTAAHSRADMKGQRTIAQPSASSRRAPIPRICSMVLPRGIID